MLRHLLKIKNSRTYTTNTVDSVEIQHFKTFVNDWWSKSGPLRALHSMNALRVPLIRDGLINTEIVSKGNINTSLPLKGVSVLDVGCGGGILTEPLARIGANVTGLDPNSDIIELAKIHSIKENLKIDYVSSPIENHRGTYDAVVASEVLEHVSNKEDFLKSCVKCLKPGGSIFITTFNKTLLADLLAIKLGEYVFEFIPKGTHQYDKFVEPHKVKAMLEQCDCRTILTHGMFYNPLSDRWTWCKDTTVNYVLQGVKLIESNH